MTADLERLMAVEPGEWQLVRDVQQMCCPRIHGCEVNDADECPAQEVRALLAELSALRESEARMREALEEAADFIETEAENREQAGSEYSDYASEPRDVLDTIRAALTPKEGR